MGIQGVYKAVSYTGLLESGVRSDYKAVCRVVIKRYTEWIYSSIHGGYKKYTGWL
jgi:hypothetical protein